MHASPRPAAPAASDRYQASSAAPSRSALRRMLPLVLFGLALVAGTIVGVNLIVHGSRASDDDAGKKPPRGEADFSVGIGHVDIESRIVNLYPVQPGEVVEIPARIKENAPVKQGWLLLRVDDMQAKLSVQLAASALEDAQIKQRQAEKLPEQHETLIRGQEAARDATEKEQAKAEALYKKAKRLFELPMPLIQEEDYTAALETVEKAKAGVRAEKEKLAGLTQQRETIKDEIARAKVNVAITQAQWEKAKHALEKCEMRAPADGMILRLLVNVGDSLGPNSKEPAIVFCPDHKRVIRAEIEQEFASKVQEGQPVTIQDDARLSGEWHGKVKRISDWYLPKRSVLMEPRQFNDVRTLECIVEVDDAKGLRIGQRVRVIIGNPKN